uniref:Ovule protein n=1 Tax=Romanomermis culicivorax TaxID=13658 RepID=A0A915JEV3_ROMCU
MKRKLYFSLIFGYDKFLLNTDTNKTRSTEKILRFHFLKCHSKLERKDQHITFPNFLKRFSFLNHRSLKKHLATYS